jgi:environmental stress-induced protein Ves
MIKLIKKSSFKESLWKNGLGSTFQIDIFPENATVAANDFLWRISKAIVNSSNSFSQFPECERQLVVWKGAGLVLNGAPLMPHTPYTFSGEQPIECDLLENSPVTDLGIIYKKKSIKASLKVIHFDNSATINLNAGTHFLFFAKGDDCKINESNLENGDCLKIENSKNSDAQLNMISLSPLIIYHIEILEQP